MEHFKFAPLFVALMMVSGTLLAVPTSPPDAGLIYQQNFPQQDMQPSSSTLPLNLQGQPLQEETEGGAKVTLKSVTFIGNTVFTEEQLHSQIGSVEGNVYDWAGLKNIVNQISLFYRKNGYTFANAVLPAQNLAEGALTIQVIEGHYGKVSTTGNDADMSKVLDTYLVPLKSGDAIQSGLLQRQLLLMSDLPGVKTTPVLKPGSQLGTGDLEVQVAQDSHIHGYVSGNNYGSRYSGEYRGQSGLQINHLLMIGDELNLSASYSSEDTWLGGIAYSLPLGFSGLRASISYSHTDYKLSHGFQGYDGTAKVTSVGLSYPVIRSQHTNINVRGIYQYKDLDDNVDMFGYHKGTHSQSLPLSLSIDHRDSLLSSGVSWGALTMTPGQLSTHQTATSPSDIHFTKWNLDLSRIQHVVAGLSVYGHFSGQWADRKVIDGSESFYLGGATGVRAYPSGEGSGSRGWLGQFEVRYQTPINLMPYTFVDTGYSPNGGIDEDHSRQISGAGLGLRYTVNRISMDGSVAWKMSSSDAQSDNKQRNPRLWFNMGYEF